MPAAARALPVLLLLYCAASFLHFAHNGHFLAEYPNLPRTFTPEKVYLAWGVLTAFGAAGFIAFHAGLKSLGLMIMGLYAALGFGGLLHYTRAPFAAHSAMMNFTILSECVTAALLLADLLLLARTETSTRLPPSAGAP
jgi:hypothetical protein